MSGQGAAGGHVLGGANLLGEFQHQALLLEGKPTHVGKESQGEALPTAFPTGSKCNKSMEFIPSTLLFHCHRNCSKDLAGKDLNTQTILPPAMGTPSHLSQLAPSTVQPGTFPGMEQAETLWETHFFHGTKLLPTSLKPSGPMHVNNMSVTC